MIALNLRKRVAIAAPAVTAAGIRIVDQVHAGHIHDVGGSQRQRVGCAVAGQIDALDAGQRTADLGGAGCRVFEGGEIEFGAAFELQGVEAATTIDARAQAAAGVVAGGQSGDQGAVDDQGVVTDAAIQHVAAATTAQGVVAGAAENDLGVRGAGNAVIVRRAGTVDGASGVAAGHDVDKIDGAGVGLAEDYVAATGIRRIGARHPDDEVGQAIAIDVAGCRKRMAAVVTRTLAIDHEAVGITAVGENRQIDRRAVRLAKHHVAATGSLNGVRSPDDEIGQAVAIDVAGCRKRRPHPVKR